MATLERKTVMEDTGLRAYLVTFAMSSMETRDLIFTAPDICIARDDARSYADRQIPGAGIIRIRSMPRAEITALMGVTAPV